MDQLIYASLSRTHYWYEVGMLKVPAVYNHDERPRSISSHLHCDDVCMYVCMYVWSSHIAKYGSTG